MFAVFIALILLAVSVGVIYVLLRNMGEEGIQVGVSRSCGPGGCGADGKAGCRGDEAHFAGMAEPVDAEPERPEAGEQPRRVA